jgi:hypothetical protein
MGGALDKIAELLSRGRCDHRTLDWPALRYQHTTLLRSLLAEAAHLTLARRSRGPERWLAAYGLLGHRRACSACTSPASPMTVPSIGGHKRPSGWEACGQPFPCPFFQAHSADVDHEMLQRLLREIE